LDEVGLALDARPGAQFPQALVGGVAGVRAMPDRGVNGTLPFEDLVNQPGSVVQPVGIAEQAGAACSRLELRHGEWVAGGVTVERDKVPNLRS
jgi:hypothetical protein